MTAASLLRTSFRLKLKRASFSLAFSLSLWPKAKATRQLSASTCAEEVQGQPHSGRFVLSGLPLPQQPMKQVQVQKATTFPRLDKSSNAFAATSRLCLSSTDSTSGTDARLYVHS